MGVAISAPPGVRGANALAPAFDNESRELFNNESRELFNTTPTADVGTAELPRQPQLFQGPPSNIIPFDRMQRQAAAQAVPQAQPSMRTPGAIANVAPIFGQDTAKLTTPRGPAKKPAMPTAEQTTIDFIPAAPPKARTLKTEVEAVIFCEQQVASPMHRFVAASIDAAIIVFAFALFVLLYLGFGGNFGDGKVFWIVLGISFAVVAGFYGAIWTIMGAETAGMRMTDLELITFDGFPIDGQARFFRFCATWVSFCSGGLGILWSMVDEESLTWHDHMSKTFPTVREKPISFVRQRR